MNISKNTQKSSYLRIAAIVILLFLLCTIGISAHTDSKVYLGGMPFGVRFGVGEVAVVKTTPFTSAGEKVSPAEAAGIVSNDIIVSINDSSVETVYDVVSAVKASSEETLDVLVQRGTRKLNVKIVPKINDETGEKQLGVMLKDSSAGIGTVTFIREDMRTFAGLGHGICDSSSGEILKIDSGYISNVKICGISKGKIGAPGELKGVLSPEKCGKLLTNTEVGVCGIRTDVFSTDKNMIDIADVKDITIGEAKILCTLDDNVRREYEIEIKELNMGNASKTKNFVIEVTDDRLLEKTGGIVQGMSGSPIVQNGKLIGAVTHVMINDPSVGYGIYIENMLEELNESL